MRSGSDSNQPAGSQFQDHDKFAKAWAGVRVGSSTSAWAESPQTRDRAPTEVGARSVRQRDRLPIMLTPTERPAHGAQDEEHGADDQQNDADRREDAYVQKVTEQ